MTETGKTPLEIVIGELMREIEGIEIVNNHGLSIQINSVFSMDLSKEYSNLKETCTRKEFAENVINALTKASMAISNYTFSEKVVYNADEHGYVLMEKLKRSTSRLCIVKVLRVSALTTRCPFHYLMKRLLYSLLKGLLKILDNTLLTTLMWISCPCFRDSRIPMCLLRNNKKKQ